LKPLTVYGTHVKEVLNALTEKCIAYHRTHETLSDSNEEKSQEIKRLILNEEESVVKLESNKQLVMISL